MRRFVIALAMFACALAMPVPHPRELMQLEKAPAAPDAANQYGSQLVKPIIDGVGKRNFMFASVTRENTLDLFKRLANGDTGFVVGCLAGGSELACGVIQFYIIMIGTAVAIPIICGFFTCCFLMCRCCPCCKSKLCCYNCGGKQPRNKKTETGEWVSGPYTRCEKMCWYTSHAIVIAILLLLSIGGAFSVNSIPSSIGVIIDALVFVMEIPGKFFDIVATPAIATAIVSMNDKVSGINTNYSTAATAVKNAAAAMVGTGSPCASSQCCDATASAKYDAISNLAALSMTFDPNAFSEFLNKTLNDQLKEGKDVIKTAMPQSTVDMIKGSKSQVLLVPATAGFVLFVPVFLPIIINLLAFICRKQCPFWCSHICAFLFSGLVFLIFILVFLVGSILTEMCVFLPAATITQPDVSGLDAVFPPKADGNSSAVPNLFKQCFAKKTGGNMFLAVNYDISGQIHSIVTSSISNDKLGLDSAALSKLEPILEATVTGCGTSATQTKLQTLRDAQLKLKSVTDNIETSTRAGVTTVLTNFANQISSCDDLATGYLGLRDSICGGFSDSIVATYFSLYGCGIFLILFLLTTCKIVKKVSRGGTVAPGQAPQVAGAPDAASSMTKTKQPNTDAHVTKTADPKGKTK